MPQNPPILEVFLRRAASSGERAVANARLVVCSLLLLPVLFLAGGSSGLLSNIPKHRWMTLGLLLGIAFSLWTLRSFKRASHPPNLLVLSVFVDAMLPVVVLLPSAFWPRESYRGLLGMPDCAIFVMAIIASSLRLSTKAVVLSGVLNCLGAASILLADISLNRDILVAKSDDYVVYGILLLGAFLITLAVVRRIRTLVFEGALAALNAERARQRLGMYVSNEVAEEVLVAEILKPGGKRCDIAVLFSDLRDFTAYSETLPPERLTSELNAYLDAMVKEVREEGGVVDK